MEEREKQLEQILWEYSGFLEHLARLNKIQGMDFDDVLQELRMIVVKCVETYDCKRGVKFNTYLTNCLRNRIKDLKRVHNRDITPLSLNAVLPSGEEFLELVASDDLPVDRHAIKDYLEQQDDKAANWLYMRIFEGLTYNEIGVRFNVTPQYVFKKCKDAEKQMEQYFKENTILKS